MGRGRFTFSDRPCHVFVSSSSQPCPKHLRFVSSRGRFVTRSHVMSHGLLDVIAFLKNLSWAIATPLRIPSRYKCTIKQMHNDMASVESRSDFINLNWCVINLVDRNGSNHSTRTWRESNCTFSSRCIMQIDLMEEAGYEVELVSVILSLKRLLFRL